MDVRKLAAQLEQEEKRTYRPYRDTEGHWTVGIGRNLDAVPFSDDEIDLMLKNDIERRAIAGLNKHLPWWTTLDEVRQRVLADMAFNLGIDGLLGFHGFLAALEAHNFILAADHMRQSKWHTQTKSRAIRLERMMLTGQD